MNGRHYLVGLECLELSSNPTSSLVVSQLRTEEPKEIPANLATELSEAARFVGKWPVDVPRFELPSQRVHVDREGTG